MDIVSYDDDFFFNAFKMKKYVYGIQLVCTDKTRNKAVSLKCHQVAQAFILLNLQNCNKFALAFKIL